MTPPQVVTNPNAIIECHAERCPVCSGHGSVNYGKQMCHACNGRGYLVLPNTIGVMPKKEKRAADGEFNK